MAVQLQEQLSKKQELKEFMSNIKEDLNKNSVCVDINSPADVRNNIHFRARQLPNWDAGGFLDFRPDFTEYFPSRELSKYSEMLSYFGMYDLIRLTSVPSKLAGTNIDVLAALEKYDVILNVLSISKISKKEICHHFHADSQKIVCALVEMVKRKHSSFKRLAKLQLLKTFIFLYIAMFWTEKYSTQRCDQYSEKYGACFVCMEITNRAKLSVGYFMIFYANIVVEMFKSMKHSELNRMINERICLRCNDLYQIKTMNIAQVVERGKEFVMQSESVLIKLHKDKQIDFNISNSARVCHILGDVYSLINREYAGGNTYYVICITAARPLHQRVSSMIALSHNCYGDKQYLIGYKLLKCAYKLSNGYMFPSFVNSNYPETKRRFKKKIKRMRCRQCNGLVSSPKCCANCMEMIYCSKKCQKIDWKKQHRYECIATWKTTYPLLKALFESL